jgi:hypothetical protein
LLCIKNKIEKPKSGTARVFTHFAFSKAGLVLMPGFCWEGSELALDRPKGQNDRRLILASSQPEGRRSIPDNKTKKRQIAA